VLGRGAEVSVWRGQIFTANSEVNTTIKSRGITEQVTSGRALAGVKSVLNLFHLEAYGDLLRNVPVRDKDIRGRHFNVMINIFIFSFP
jgi:hypothetical protein